MTKKSILYIEDDEDDRRLFELSLKKLETDYDLVLAKDGEEGINILKKNQTPFFLIICDASMPKLNGVEVLKMMNEDPKIKMKKVPFILITGQKNPQVVIEAFNLSTQGFFKKATTLEGTMALIKTVVDYWEQGYII
jgi:CheY-like chemotaxis protein